MHRRPLLLIVALLTFAVAAPVVDGKPVRIDGRHHRGPRRIDGRSHRGPRRIGSRAGRRARRRSARRRARHHSPPQGAGITGVYTGETSYPPPSFAPDGDPYVSSFVLRVNDGRMTGIALTVRMECPEIAILERHVNRIVFRGPALGPGGGLSFSEGGVRLSGHVGANSAGGSISGTVDGCSVAGGATWEAKKKQF